MEDMPTNPHPDPAVVTIGDLDPVYGKFVEMDYAGRVVAERYRVCERIGSGGMADVYRAHDERLRCDVAIKFLKPRLASEEWCARMFQEARASAAIDHPHLLRVTDVGRIGPSIYLAMDLLQGASLAAVLRAQPEQRLPWRRVFELLLPVAGAFQAAHDRGFIHRDIKPDNLFLHRSGDEERVIVLDLGIVKRIPAAQSLGVGLAPTATGFLLGTPAFMSPEQAAGVAIDARTDIYSFGVTLYRAVTGRLPFLANGDAFVVLTKHLYEAPPEFAAQGLGPEDCPAEVERLILRTLAKRPEDRHATMRELAAAMRAALGAVSLAAPRLLAAHEDDTDTGVNPHTPQRSVRLRGFGGLSVAASVIGTLAGWPPPMAAVEVAAIAGDSLATGPGELSLREIPDRVPPVEIPVVAEPVPVLDPEPDSGVEAPGRLLRRGLKGYTRAVARCQYESGDPDARSLRVELEVSRSGAVVGVRTGGVDASTLDDCVQRALWRAPVDPSLVGRQLYTFRFPVGGAS